MKSSKEGRRNKVTKFTPPDRERGPEQLSRRRRRRAWGGGGRRRSGSCTRGSVIPPAPTPIRKRSKSSARTRQSHPAPPSRPPPSISRMLPHSPPPPPPQPPPLLLLLLLFARAWSSPSLCHESEPWDARSHRQCRRRDSPEHHWPWPYRATVDRDLRGALVPSTCFHLSQG